MGAEAAKALNKWDGGRGRRGEVGLLPPQFWGLGYYPREICADIGSNLCNLVHLELKSNLAVTVVQNTETYCSTASQQRRYLTILLKRV